MGCVSRRRTVLSRACIRAAPGLLRCEGHWHGDLKYHVVAPCRSPSAWLPITRRPSRLSRPWKRDLELSQPGLAGLTCMTPARTWSIIKKEKKAKEEEKGTRANKQTKCCFEGYAFAISVDIQTFFFCRLNGAGLLFDSLEAAARFCHVCCRSTA